MKTMRYIRLLSRFYLSFLLFSLAVDIAAAMLYGNYGSGIFPMLWLLKSAALLFSFYTINRRKKKEYYYYYNQGISRKQIWIPIIIFDIFLFLMTTYFVHV